MRCSRCSSEIPAHANFCLRCGQPANATLQGAPSPIRVQQPARASSGNGKKIATVAAILLVVGAGSLIGWKALANRGGNVVNRAGVGADGGALTDRSGLVSDGGDPTRSKGIKENPVDPSDVIDYLAFLKGIERERVLLQKKQVGDLLKQSGDLTYAGAQADWTTNEPEQRYKEVYQRFQTSMQGWAADWQSLSQKFLTKQAPQSCVPLRDGYHDLLGKTYGAVASVGNAFSDAMSGQTDKALALLSGQQGSGIGTPSKDVYDACLKADEALAAVCDKFRIRKEFDIKDEMGGGNILGR